MKYEIEIPEGMTFDAENSIISFKPVTNIEELFLSLWNDCTIKIDKKKYHNSIFWFKDDIGMFELDLKSNILWCDYSSVWSVLQEETGWKYDKIQAFIKDQVEKHFKMKGVTPLYPTIGIDEPVEKHFKMKGVTPQEQDTLPLCW